MGAAFTDNTPPWLVIKGQMCHYFSCLPSELDEEPMDEILHTWQAVCLYEDYKSKRDTPEGES
jgi:hypothetical protein